MSDGIPTDPMRARIRDRLFGPATEARRVGRFVLQDFLGSGSMGVVYAAYDEELDRRVAVKVLTETHRGPAERLAQEARALARLSHPNVVAVHEVGTHEGQVFMAMELVEGSTLRAWVDEEPRPWRQVVEKFCAAGRGLAAAHAVGLVHRDFKPENVLVDEGGRVRVVDFGLARSVVTPNRDPNVEGLRDIPVTVFTAAGAWSGTPAYMAPEQFKDQAEARSDQFAFAVALYEALFGRRPFAGRTLFELRSNMASHNVGPVSTSAVPRHVQRVLLRALEASPSLRFDSMDEMLDALARDPWAARRRAAGWALATAATVGLIVAATNRRREACPDPSPAWASVWNDGRAAVVRDALAAAGASDTALTRVRSDLDAYVAAWNRGRSDACRATLAGRQSKEVMQLRMLCFDQRLREAKAVIDTLAGAGEDTASQALVVVRTLPRVAQCDDVAALMAAVPLPVDRRVRSEVVDIRGQIAAARTLATMGRYQQSRETARRALERADAVEYAPVRAEAAVELGEAEMYAGDLEAGESHLLEAVEVALRSGHWRAAADGWQTLVWSFSVYRNDDDRAEMVARNAKAVLEGMPGEHDLLAITIGKLGWLRMRQGRFAEAEALQLDALERRRAVWGPDHPSVAFSLHYLGDLYMEMGDPKRARRYYRRAVGVFNAASLGGHPQVGSALHQVASTYVLERRPADAVPYFVRSIRDQAVALGPDHPTVAAARARYAAALIALGRLQRAQAELSAARGPIQRKFGVHHSMAIYLDVLEARVKHGQGDWSRAEAIFDDAIRRLDSQNADADVLVEALEAHGRLLLDAGRARRARRQLTRALGARRKRYGADHEGQIATLRGLATAAERLGLREERDRYAAEVRQLVEPDARSSDLSRVSPSAHPGRPDNGQPGPRDRR